MVMISTEMMGSENNTSTMIQQQQQQQPIVDMKDVWATSEGYTPLQDFNVLLPTNDTTRNDEGTTSSSTGGCYDHGFVAGGAYFSDGTTGGTIYTSFPGAFYANIAQQQDDDDNDWDNVGGDDDIEEKEDEEVEEVGTDAYQDYNYLHNEDDDDGEMTTTATTTTTNTTSTSFYDSIPDYRSVADHALSMLDREYSNIISLEQQQQLQRHNDNEQESLQEDSCESDNDDDDEGKNDNSKVTISGNTEGMVFNDTDEPSHTSLLTSNETKIVKNIDTEAVRRAVQTIQLTNPKLEQNLRLWEKKQQKLQPFREDQLFSAQQPHPSMTYTHPSSCCMAPRLHPIIPELPLKAFRKISSAKAIQATANLTRSVCIAEALHRYNILQYHPHQEQTIRIHVLGCDHVEIGYHNSNARSSTTTVTTNEPNLPYDLIRIRTLFGPIVRWMGAHAEAPSHIHIELIGPNIPQHVAIATISSPIDLLPNTVTDTSNTRRAKQSLQSATLRCHSGTYEDILQNDANTNEMCVGTPDLAIAFNAGVWGYQEWVTTIRYMIQHQSQSIPFVITAYTYEEAEDDYDTIADIVKQLQPVDHKQIRCVWDVEHNPFASNLDHTTMPLSNTLTQQSSSHSSRRRENAAWQSWRL
jgi:hypothetical protein